MMYEGRKIAKKCQAPPQAVSHIIEELGGLQNILLACGCRSQFRDAEDGVIPAVQRCLTSNLNATSVFFFVRVCTIYSADDVVTE